MGFGFLNISLTTLLSSRTWVLAAIIPLDALRELKRTPEDVQRTSNGQIHLSAAEFGDSIQIMDVLGASRVSNRNRAPFSESLHQIFVDALLEAFVIGCVDEEFAAVLLEELYVLLARLVSKF